MDDKLIEQKLRESFSPEPPAGMRERVLDRARSEFPAESRARVPWFLNWRLAFAVASMLVILIGNLSESARDSRLSALTGAGGSNPSRGVSIPDRARQIECLLASSSVECEEGGRRGGSM